MGQTKPATQTPTVDKHTRKKGGRRKPPKDLPRVRVVHDLLESQKHCRCGACLQRIGEAVAEKYDVVPAALKSVGRTSQRPEAVLAREALGFIRRLYQVERGIKEQAPQERLRRRQADSQAVLDELLAWRD